MVSSLSALGIGAASFASFFGQQSTDNGQQSTDFFLSGEKTEASKDIAESPARSERPKEGQKANG